MLLVGSIIGLLCVALVLVWRIDVSGPRGSGADVDGPPTSRPDASIDPDPRAGAPATPSAANLERSGGTSADGDPDEPGHADHAALEDPTGDLELYRERPMSAVPHEVVRGWGARRGGRIPGLVGAYVVVDPSRSDQELERLARDIRDFHYDAEALSVRILDSEEAAVYDRHGDGGALAAEHLVGRVNVNERLGVNRIEIRGRVIESAEADAR
jgi:hypothetical protein